MGKHEMGDQEGQREPRPVRRWRWIGLGIVVLGLVGLVLVARILRPGPEANLPVADVASERLLAVGSVVGFAAPFETHAWLGIPFARPPVGPLRWRSPQPPETWVDTFDALSFGAPCLQLGSALGGIPAEDEEGFGGSEDCLTLNVWAPREDAEPVARARRPVMVWIHGGGNTRGAASLAMYEGARLAGTEDVVVVSFQYRLGPLGWFSHPALRSLARDPLEASGNFGTLDQIRALEWIQSNIGEFGGDPENVTIFGQSAGGTNVMALLLAEETKGLFHRAISQSGSTRSVSRAEAENWTLDEQPGHRHSSKESVAALIEAAGVVPDREAARGYTAELPPEDLLEFLEGRTGRDILNVYREPGSPESLDVPQPIRDGVLLPESDWIEEFRAGRFHHVPVLLGSNRDEMKLYFSQDEEHVRKRFGFLYRIRDPDDYHRRARLHSDLWAIRGVNAPAEAMHSAGWPEVFAYRFDWDGLPMLLGQDMSELIGAGHGFELPLLFGTFDIGDPLLSRLLYPEEGRAEREGLSRRMMAYWAEFARTGRPSQGSREDLPEWESWAGTTGAASEALPGSAGEARLLVLDSEVDGGIRMSGTSLSREQVIATVEAQADLAQAEKCALFLDLLGDRPDWPRESVRRIRQGGCTGFLQ